MTAYIVVGVLFILGILVIGLMYVSDFKNKGKKDYEIYKLKEGLYELKFPFWRTMTYHRSEEVINELNDKGEIVTYVQRINMWKTKYLICCIKRGQ